MTEHPSETDVEALAEQIDARPWSVEGYEFEGGSDAPFTVTLEVEWVGEELESLMSTEQRDRLNNMKSIVKDLEDKYDEGAPVAVILDRAESDGMDRDAAEHELDKLRRQGDVYEPATDHLRSV